MANQEHVKRLLQGARKWNEWRPAENPIVDLRNAHLSDANLRSADLRRANLSRAGPNGANLENSTRRS